MLKLIFATDLHGHCPAYEALWVQAVAHKVNAVVLGGDLLPHGTLPWQAAFLRDWLAPRLRRFRGEQPQTSVYGMLGNDDWACLAAEWAPLEKERAFFDLHQRATVLSSSESLWIAGCALVPSTPFGMSDCDRLDSPGWTPPPKMHPPLFSTADGIREGTLDEILTRESVQEALRKLARLSAPARTVYVIHSPPFNTRLDRLLNGQPIGSPAVRGFIEQFQPPLTLHGHIHESPAVSGSIADQISKTVALNPGASRDQLRAVVIEMDGGRVRWKLV